MALISALYIKDLKSGTIWEKPTSRSEHNPSTAQLSTSESITKYKKKLAYFCADDFESVLH